MKLYDGGRVPNARRVRIFLAEKGIELPIIPVDLGKMEHRSPEFARINALKTVPVLELDDGSHLSESVAICRYFEELHPSPPLFGTGALGKARVEMWNRRIELELFMSIQAVFRHLHPGMAGHEIPQIAAWGEVNKPRVLAALALLDQQLAKQEFAAGDAYSIADITALVAIDFLKPVKIAVPEEMVHLVRWYKAMQARPSSAA